MKRRGKRKSDGVADPPPGRRVTPFRRRLLMVAVIAVAGVIIFLLSVQQQATTEAVLEGKVFLDGQPFGGATVTFTGESRGVPPTTAKQQVAGPVISRYSLTGRSDADGRYRVTLQPGMLYRVSTRDPTKGKEPLHDADGNLPAVQVNGGRRHFDIQLASPPAAK